MSRIFHLQHHLRMPPTHTPDDSDSEEEEAMQDNSLTIELILPSPAHCSPFRLFNIRRRRRDLHLPIEYSYQPAIYKQECTPKDLFLHTTTTTVDLPVNYFGRKYRQHTKLTLLEDSKDLPHTEFHVIQPPPADVINYLNIYIDTDRQPYNRFQPIDSLFPNNEDRQPHKRIRHKFCPYQRADDRRKTPHSFLFPNYTHQQPPARRSRETYLTMQAKALALESAFHPNFSIHGYGTRPHINEDLFYASLGTALGMQNKHLYSIMINAKVFHTHLQTIVRRRHHNESIIPCLSSLSSTRKIYRRKWLPTPYSPDRPWRSNLDPEPAIISLITPMPPIPKSITLKEYTQKEIYRLIHSITSQRFGIRFHEFKNNGHRPRTSANSRPNPFKFPIPNQQKP